ncbi:PQQ-binding-like beta-propeller repeat protein [Spirilliplanes yamanashiensis]|uniref:Pyrrolo-quinoline quinone repeat domain-containing protein n=1 Tax=Spirilliplanes yamanashiensis TaxID=42233 RepID=A0A8J3Y4C2_9ACTN|nr:hypothetical protein Sya03_06040 [Spirilliplanes yamanashiensis]
MIELGTPGAGPAPAAAPGPRRLSPGSRAAAAVLAVAAALLLLAAAAPPDAGPVRRVATVPFDDQYAYSSDGELLYVPTAGALSAYRLADGRRRWSVALGASGVRWDAPAGVLLGRAPGGAATVALDPATGAELWELPGTVAGTRAGTVLLTEGDAGQARVARARTGELLWSGPVARTDTLALAGPGLLAVLAQDGAATVRRLDGPTGEPPVRGRVERRFGAVDPLGSAETLTIGGRLHLVDSDAYGTTVAAYRLDTLERLWRVQDPAQRTLHDCGPVLCLAGGGSLDGLDPATGERRWVNDAWAGVLAATGGLLAVQNDDRVLPHLGQVDAATGRTVADLGDGTFAWGTPDLLVRQDRADPRDTVVVRVAGGRATPAGTLDGTVREACEGAGAYLVCPTVDDVLAVWRVTAGR